MFKKVPIDNNPKGLDLDVLDNPQLELTYEIFGVFYQEYQGYYLLTKHWRR